MLDCVSTACAVFDMTVLKPAVVTTAIITANDTSFVFTVISFSAPYYKIYWYKYWIIQVFSK